MILLWVTVGLALVLGALMPLRWGVWGLTGAAFLVWNVQVSYRAFAGPLLALVVPLIWRYAR